jgi:hypothetical protein
VRKKLGLRLESEKTDGERLYRIIAGKASADSAMVSSRHASRQKPQSSRPVSGCTKSSMTDSALHDLRRGHAVGGVGWRGRNWERLASEMRLDWEYA